MMHCPDTYLPWFLLAELPGLSSRAIKNLIQHFETPDAIFKGI